MQTMSEIDDLPRDPNAVPIYDANGDPWAPPDPEELQRILISDELWSFARMYRSCMAEIVNAHVNCRCVLADPLPAPTIPRNERFDDWRKRTAALLDECAKEKR